MKSDSSLPAGDHMDIGGYLTGELDQEQLRQAQEHLAGCAECRAEVESLQEWENALKAVPEAMLRRRGGGSRRRGRRRRPGGSQHR
jgi:anti-sigma factor RsiW